MEVYTGYLEKIHHFERIAEQWSRLLREVVKSSTPELLKRHVDVVLRDMA